MAHSFDLIVCGAGPAGLAAAIAAVRRGWRVALLERSEFPRHKVCGDCLNPSVWPVLESLGMEGLVGALEHAPLKVVRFVSRSGRCMEVRLPAGAERAVTRSLLDHSLMQQAAKLGVAVF